MDQRTVLIISDDAEFARSVVGRWQTERTTPAFTQMSSDLWSGASDAHFDIAVVGPVSGRLPALLDSLEAPRRPVLYVGNSSQVQAVREQHPRVLALRDYEGWAEALVLLGSEALRRAEAAERARRAEQAATLAQRQATLGRYMIEMRHRLNNALTSVLGNAELLLLEPGALSAQVRDQVDTIHSMALRIHEIIQRFSSLETELQFNEKQSQGETNGRPQLYVPGD